MARNNGRWGRLRRVLNEDLSTSVAAYATTTDRAPGDTPRYGAGANIENHPQVTDYIPRRFGSIALVVAAGAALGAVAQAAAHYADSLAAVSGVAANQIAASLADGLVNWTSAVSLVITAAYARIIFLLKRHRLDDLRGRYRVWRQAGWLALAVSANFVVGAHALVAQAAAHLSGWQPLESTALWWIVPTAVIGGWVMVRLVLDAAECRSALAAYTVALACFTSAVACAAGWAPLGSAAGNEAMTRLLPVAGCLAALLATILTARYVVLDVQGLIEHDTSPAKPAAVAATRSKSELSASTTGAAAVSEMETTAWVDGTEPDDDYADDERPLSKAERKRLRKQHGRYRAA